MKEANSVRVRFPLQNDPLGIEAEWMWCTLSADGSSCTLDNSPFHVYGVSWKDEIHVDPVEGALQFAGIARKNGHRTLRIRFPASGTHHHFENLWPPLAQLGCTYEGSQIERPLYAIDLAPDVSLDQVISHLERLEQSGLIEYEEADT